MPTPANQSNQASPPPPVLLTDEWAALNAALRRDFRAAGYRGSYGLTATPLLRTSVLVVGNNWGGAVDAPPPKRMPLTNEMLVYPTNPTYRGYLHFFRTVFDGDDWRMLTFLHRIVYLNGNFVRTPNQTAHYKDLLALGRTVSAPHLRTVLDLVRPELIICFGNGPHSGTDAIATALGKATDFRADEELVKTPAGNRTFAYCFPAGPLLPDSTVYSYAHGNRYNQWMPGIERNVVFRELKYALRQRFPFG